MAAVKAILAKMDELIAANRAASVPHEYRWLDADGVASMLCLKPRYVRERLSLRPDFPAPMRIDGSGHPRWLASEVQSWALKHRAT